MTTPSADPASVEIRPVFAAPPAPLDGFTQEEFRARRAALRAACPDGLIVLRGSTEGEVVAPGRYHQNSSFFYLTGIDTPGALLVMLPEAVTASAGLRDLSPHVREILFLPARSAHGETWTGPKLGPGEEAEKASGIEKVENAGSFWNGLTGWLQRCPLTYTLVPYGDQAPLTRDYAFMKKIADAAPTAQFRDLGLPLSRQRMVKSPAEIERIEQAMGITAEAQAAAQRLIARGGGRGECEVEGTVLEIFRRHGATPAFPCIIGAGLNGTVLHYEENQATMRDGEAVVVDIGARLGHYCADLTRSYPVGGRFSARQEELHGLVAAAFRFIVADCRPGVDTLKTLSDRCKAYLKESVVRARDGAGAEQTMDTFMPHGLTHHLGLDVHDMCDREMALAPGHVITIEPGIYVPSEGIGIRLEHDFLVTETGLKRLGPDLSLEIV